LALPTVTSAGLLELNASHSAIVKAPLVASSSSCAVGSAPDGMAYDPVSHTVYVPNRFSENLSILQGCTVVATITFPLGALLVQAGFNPTNNLIYVTDEALNQVYVISGTKLLETIASPNFDGPFGVAFDPGTADMAVANDYSNTVTFIHDTTVAFSATVGLTPTFFAYDSHCDRFLVANYGSDNVTSMRAVSPGVERDNINIPVGPDPVAIAFDVANSLDYVTNLGSNNVTIISGTGGQHGSVTVGPGPRLLVWDQAHLSIYVAVYSPGTVSVIQGHSVVRIIHGPAGADFSGITYDAANDRAYVGGWNTGQVYLYK